MDQNNFRYGPMNAQYIVWHVNDFGRFLTLEIIISYKEEV
jgi:hypothetical protein